MEPFNKCPVCGNKLIKKTVEKLLRGGVHTASVKVEAAVCERCGERLYSQEDIKKFEEIRKRLEQGQTSEFHSMGYSFQL